MRSDLDHLRASKQRDLERVAQILFEELEEARALSTQEWKKKRRILKIILYGSYGRGGWIDAARETDSRIPTGDTTLWQTYAAGILNWAKCELEGCEAALAPSSYHELPLPPSPYVGDG